MASGASPPRGSLAAPDDDQRLESRRHDAPEVAARSIARRLLASGQPEMAAAELIRSARERPMNARTALALTSMALATGRTGPIHTVVAQGLDEAEGQERVGVLRALARLQRRTGQEQRAIETLTVLLAEEPEDRRSRMVLNRLLEHAERWDELDASCDKETRLLLRRRSFRAASRVALRRARVWGERLQEYARAALRYGQAAQYAEQGQDPHSVFLLRLLWLRSLVQADAPGRSLDEATRAVLDVAARVGKEARARSFIRELGLKLPTAPGVERVAEPFLPDHEVTAIIRASKTLVDLEVAEADAAPGAVSEAFLSAAASSPGASDQALMKLEARYLARGAWKELARLYRETADARREPAGRAPWLEKLAELLENELDDAVGAAKVWAEAAYLTDDAVEGARLLILRADEAKARGDRPQARAALEEALRHAPGSLAAAAGLAELAAEDGDAAPSRILERLLLASSHRLPERPALFRRLAKVADLVSDARLALAAWSEVLAAGPQDDEALARLWVLALALSEDVTLERVLKQVLAKDPRGERARRAWLDLVSMLERNGRFDEALALLREAVKAEPGSLRAWVSLVDRLQARWLDDEAAWALENAATVAPEGPQRVSLWRRLARHARERLGDEERAEKYEERIDRVRAEQAALAHADPKLPGGPLVVPQRRPKSPLASEAVKTLTDEAESEVFARALGAAQEPESSRPFVRTPLPPRLRRVLDPIFRELNHQTEAEASPTDDFASDDDVDEVMEGASEAGEELDGPKPAESRTRSSFEERQTQELPVARVELGDPFRSASPSFGPSPSEQLSDERQALFKQVRANPLEPNGYRLLADHFDTANDANRSSLMLELARALEGDLNAVPRTPKLILSAADRASLRHPLVRTEAAELIALSSPALFLLFPPKGKEASSTEEFSLESGKGARPAADALLASVRLLGMRAPDVFVSDDGGPPFSALQTSPTRLVVSRAAVKKALISEPELRFYAGRALFTLSGELLALRTLRREHLRSGLEAMSQMLKGQSSTEAKVIRDALQPRSYERLKTLWPRVAKSVDLSALMEGARHTVNRAGLVVCGGIAPAIASLRLKKALPGEVTELVRFAASEVYLQLRNRRLGKST
jgi:cellulose synthase operon protein C